MNPENLPAGREMNVPHLFMPHPFLHGGYAIPPIAMPSGINTVLPLESQLMTIQEKMPVPSKSGRHATTQPRRRK